MKVRYGGEYRRLQQERNLLLIVLILLTLLWWATVALYERRLEQLERLHHPQGSLAPAQGFVLLHLRRGLFLSGAEPRGCASTEGCAIARTDAGCA